MQMPEPTMRIALLSQAGESGRHLRDALAGSGTPIVYEAQATELDREALEKSGASVVVVNLDADVEAHLDEVYSLLDDDRYNVIFNEAQVSSQLSGWEQARWARHLAAKILGTENADPPRPAGAEPVPMRAVDPAHGSAASEAPAISADIVEPAAAAEPELTLAKEAVPSVEDDYSDIADLLGEVSAESDDLSDGYGARAAESTADLHKTVQMPELDLSEFDIELEGDSVKAAGVDDEPGDAEAGSEESLATMQIPSLDLESGAEAEALGFGDLDDFADGLDDPEFEADAESAASAPEMEALGPSLDSEAASTGDDVTGLEMLDLDWAGTPEPPGVQDAREILEEAPPPETGSAFAWSLEEIEDEQDTAEQPPAEARDFGIEKVSASDYLAPELAETASPEPAVPESSLELIPLDEAVAPVAVDKKSSQSEGRETWLETGTRVAVKRVWVLGASIGGPEAVREFLAELPAKCPALFLLAQHMGAEFMEIMAQQLSRSTSLTVRTPTHGERVSHGDIVVVPTTHRLRVDREGVITLESLGEANLPNTPSIDQVLQDVADRFGSNAGFIVFSGMAEDAAEGSRYLAGIGGKVYAQDPETCVISSMVDGVIDTGVVSFVGSPKALAGKLLGELKS